MLESLGAGCQRMGTCVRNCSGGCSQVHSDDECGTDFTWEQFAVGYICGQYRPSNSFVAVALFSRNCGANPTMSLVKGTGPDDDNRMQVDSLKKGKEKGKGKHQNQEENRTSCTCNLSNTDINTTGHWVKDCGKPGGGAYDNNTRNNRPHTIGNKNKKGTGKGKQVDVVETNQSAATATTVSYPSQTPSTIGALSCNSET